MRLLVLTPRICFPMNAGGRIRSFQLFRGLAQHFELKVVTHRFPQDAPPDLAQMSDAFPGLELHLTPEAPRKSPRFFYELGLNLISGLPYASQKYLHPGLGRLLRRIALEWKPDALLVDFVHPAPLALEWDLCPRILLAHNVETTIWQRHAENASDPVRRSYFGLQARRMEALERRVAASFEHCSMASAVDRERWLGLGGAEDRTSWLPLGVDLDYFAPDAARPAPDRVVFVGSLDWMANQDGLRWFVGEVWPLIRARRPTARLHLVGRRPTPEMRALGRQPGVTVVGEVPDVRPELAAASCVVVPLRVGGGIRLKIYEALSAQRPVVSTTIGAEGLPLTDGEQILLADEPESFAAAVEQVLAQPLLARSLATRGRRLVAERFSWTAVADELAGVIRGVVG